ncbi:MAG TPA: YceI family protein [Bryobacteraceae bacterium]|nr:YceI family protein [Bryobacteraceae bacterium]
MSTPAATGTVVYQIDPQHSAAMFKVRHLMISNVKGEFTKVSGTVTLDPTHELSAVEITIDATSINTREPDRDTHLKSADFLDVEKFPTITFRSKKIKPEGKDEFKVIGDLTIHGVTKEVTLEVDSLTPEAKDPWGFYRRGASASTTINRKDFGLVWNMALETGGVVVGEDVHITIDAEFARKA